MKNKLKSFLKNIISLMFSEKILVLISKLEPRIFLKKSKNFWKLKKIAKYDLNNTKLYTNPYEKFGIVVQGPIIEESHFTLETLKLLRKNYPLMKIVLSTWIDQTIDEDILKELDIQLLRNDYPKNGLNNLNYQIISTYNGILELKKLGVEYVLKLRTDQRILNKEIDIYLKTLTEIFPIKLDNILQKKRIICTGMNTYKYQHFSISDMFQFGYIDDILNFWDVDLTTSETIIKEERLAKKKNICNCEYYLYINYFRKVYQTVEIPVTLEKYYEILKDNVIIIDTLDIYWYKYNIIENKFSNDINEIEEKFTEIDWYNLQKFYIRLDWDKIRKIETWVLERRKYI